MGQGGRAGGGDGAQEHRRAELACEVRKYLNNKLNSRSMHYSAKPSRQPPPRVILPLRRSFSLHAIVQPVSDIKTV